MSSTDEDDEVRSNTGVPMLSLDGGCVECILSIGEIIRCLGMSSTDEDDEVRSNTGVPIHSLDGGCVTCIELLLLEGVSSAACNNILPISE